VSADAAALGHDWFARPVPPNVSLGSGTWLYSSFAFLHFASTRPAAVTTGRACGIYHGCFFDLGPAGEVHIGDYSTLVGVIVATNRRVHIGSYCFFAHEVVIADVPHAAPGTWSDTEHAAGAAADDAIVIGDDVWVGMGAVLLKGSRIGPGAIVGAGAVVDFEVPAHAVVAGNPARVVSSPPGDGGTG